jgi:hypothetical protein
MRAFQFATNQSATLKQRRTCSCGSSLVLVKLVSFGRPVLKCYLCGRQWEEKITPQWSAASSPHYIAPPSRLGGARAMCFGFGIAPGAACTDSIRTQSKFSLSEVWNISASLPSSSRLTI